MKIMNIILLMLSFYICLKAIQAVGMFGSPESFNVSLLTEAGTSTITGLVLGALIGGGITGVLRADPITIAFTMVLSALWANISSTINGIYYQIVPFQVSNLFSWIPIVIYGVGFLLIVIAGIQMAKGGWATME